MTRLLEEKVYSTLSNGASLLKLAVTCVVHSIKSNPEQYVSLMYGKYSPTNYNLPSHSVHTDDYSTQDLKILLTNDAPANPNHSRKMSLRSCRNMLISTKKEYYLTRNSRNSKQTCYQKCNLRPH